MSIKIEEKEMKSKDDVRWQQRLQNYEAGLKQLTVAIEISAQRQLNDLEKQGTIQVFEFTHELAWNLLKDYFEDQGNSSITGSKDATREAFRRGLISNGDIWMEMIKSRNQSSHTYNQEVSKNILIKIINDYHNEFVTLLSKMKKLK